MAELVRVRLSTFFDRKRVIDAVDKATRKVLSQAGAFIRQTARTSIRKRKAISQPGNPPSSHEGSLRRHILFGYDRENESVVIGPRADFNGTSQTPKAPEALEFGGTVRRNNETFRYRARPFMGPALEKEAPKFPQLFRNSVRR